MICIDLDSEILCLRIDCVKIGSQTQEVWGSIPARRFMVNLNKLR